MPDEHTISRREMLIKGSAAVAGVALLPSSLLANFLSEELVGVASTLFPPKSPVWKGSIGSMERLGERRSSESK